MGMFGFGLTRAWLRRTAGLAFVYSVGLAGSLWLAYQLRFDFAVPADFRTAFLVHVKWIVPLKLALLVAFRQFSGLLRYFSVPDLRRLFYSMGSAAGLLILIWVYSKGAAAPPRGVILSDFVISLMGIAGARLGFRLYREGEIPDHRRRRSAKRVGIVGAGDVGASLARELNTKRSLRLVPVAFFDDDRAKWGSRIHGIPVIGGPERLLMSELNLQLDEAIIAMPMAPAKRIGEIVRILQKSHLKFETVPALDQLATGQVKVTQLRSVEIQDLLGRDPIKLETENIRKILGDRVVMVTGAGGSIGSELCRQIALYNPQRLLLVEQSEVHSFQIEQELIERGYGGIILPLVADILDLPRMRYLFQRFQPNVIFHAAAHKHVPMMESQPSEAIQNNTLGTARVAGLAVEFEVDRFVLISTDKAINPTNVMGATKRLAEIVLQSVQARKGVQTKLMAVRFGNVLGSSGSVIPTFQKQIEAGGPVRVTHPDVTRYFMTIPEAAGLVLQSATQGIGGEIFVLDMGQPVKIVDLAKQLIELSGLRVDEDIEIEFVGMRPGEKLFEELCYQGENIQPTDHPKIVRYVSEARDFEQVNEMLDRLTREMYRVEPNQLKMLLNEAVPEYKPFLT